MEDVLSLIMQAYCKPTCAQMPHDSESPYVGELPPLLEQNRHIAHDASLVSKKWRVVALAAQRTAVKAMREAFFAQVVDFVLGECQAPAATINRKCLLRHAGVTTTVVSMTLGECRTPHKCYLYVKHYPVDAEQRMVTCMQPSPDGPQRPPLGYNVRCRDYRLDEMPHYRFRDGVPGLRAPLWLADVASDACRSEQQHKETHTWLAALAQQVLQGLLQDFAALNERDWHRQRFRV